MKLHRDANGWEGSDPRPTSYFKTEVSVKKFRWRITNKETQETTIYYAKYRRPVTEEHARTAPSVVDWAGGAAIDVVPIDKEKHDQNEIKTGNY